MLIKELENLTWFYNRRIHYLGIGGIDNNTPLDYGQ